jgi:hypothetical protein
MVQAESLPANLGDQNCGQKNPMCSALHEVDKLLLVAECGYFNRESEYLLSNLPVGYQRVDGQTRYSWLPLAPCTWHQL